MAQLDRLGRKSCRIRFFTKLKNNALLSHFLTEILVQFKKYCEVFKMDRFMV